MAAGGSAPELFTSLIGAVVTKNDVGFGTIVGSAVFNVLAVIGACGVSALEPIPLTWWPLFRDCCYYIYGLALLAAFSYGKALDCSDGTKQGGGAVSLAEAIILFLSYILYCIIMYFNDRIEGLLPKKKDKATVVEIEKVPAPVGNPAVESKSDGLKELRVSDHEDSQDPIGGIESTNHSGLRLSASDLESAPGPPEHHIGRDQAVDHTPSEKDAASQMSHHAQLPQLGHHSSMTIPGLVGISARIPSNNSGQVRTSSNNANHNHLNNPEHQTIRVGKHHRVVYGDDGLKHDLYHSPRPDGERRPSKSGIHCGERRPSRSGEAKLQEHLAGLKANSVDTETKVQEVASRKSDMTKDSDDDLEKPAKSQDGDDEEAKTSNSGGSTDTDDIEALMWRPSDLTGQIQWYLSLPIYAPLYYCIPRPDGDKGFVPAFILSLVFIAGFSLILVYCVELFGKAILGGGNNVTIVMSFTLLAAGTSIPDLVSSMRLREPARATWLYRLL
jgi:Ca2+/Na+ antiporter